MVFYVFPRIDLWRVRINADQPRKSTVKLYEVRITVESSTTVPTQIKSTFKVLERESGLLDWRTPDGTAFLVTLSHDVPAQKTRVRMRLGDTLDWTAFCSYLEVGARAVGDDKRLLFWGLVGLSNSSQQFLRLA